MRVCVIKNESCGEPGLIAEWIQERNHSLTIFEAYSNKFPELDSFDLLVILGGEVSANDDLPWIKNELAFLKEAIEQKSLMLGICLGAQLLSKALGGYVTKNPVKEIGWFNLKCPINFLEDNLKVFQFHAETFSIPPGGELLASTDTCRNQAFSFSDNVLGLQFHLESDIDLVKLRLKIAESSSEILPKGQDMRSALAQAEINLPKCREQLFDLLDGFELSLPKSPSGA